MYADNAATTPLRQEVKNKILDTLDVFANPSSAYSISYESTNLINNARDEVAKLIGADSDEIYFTSGGSESDNWAIKGVAYKSMIENGGSHIITTKIEHPAIRNTCKALEQIGFKVTYLDVDSNGIVSPIDVLNSIREDTILVSVMYANNEVGTIQLIDEIAKIVKEHNIIFHTDAVQAVGHIPIDVHKSNIDLLSLSGHKFNAPKGIGALYIKRNLELPSFINGGKQEKHKRGGTENILGIVGIGEAAKITRENYNAKYVSDLRIKAEILLKKNIENIIINGESSQRLAGHLNVSIKDVSGESLVLLLSQRGVYVSSGSACSSGELTISPTLQAMKIPEDYIKGSIRISLSDLNNEEEIVELVNTIKECVYTLRKINGKI